MNRLSREKSPYLLQHAQNPVHWYAWGPEAFEAARKEHKLIFLSIGYSTCHWCHVMEHESFENEEVAKLLNQDFISIKVDREERPDIDHIYMTAVQALTGTGGWPLSIFLTPEGKPVTGGTYFPPDDKWGRPGMKTILPRLSSFWREKPEEMKEAAQQLASLLQPKAPTVQESNISEVLLERAYQSFEASFDAEHGGFGGAPKFPRSHDLSFLLRRWKRTKTPQALEMVEKTLIHMATGGIYDHLGGGIARYSTDAHWLVPHFEKMLYDQAVVSKTYLEAFQASGKSFYADVARDIFRYVLRDMTSPEGGFYSAEDADSEGEEGLFYVWRPEEIKKILGEKDGDLFCGFFGVTEQGNFEHQASILSVNQSLESFAKEKGIEADKFRTVLAQMRQKLFTERRKRIPPYKDDKILTAWNGLMISSLAYGSTVLQEPAFAAAASKAASFILNKMTKEGRLLRRHREGESAIDGFQDDYACFALSLLDLYEATFEIRWLEEAVRLTKQMIQLFKDEQGGFFYTASDGEALITRTKEYYDGATPSGNSLAACLLLRLSRMTGDTAWEKEAEGVFRSNAEALHQHPVAFSQLLIAADFALGPSQEVVIAGDSKSEDFSEFLKTIYSSFAPNRVLLHHPSEGSQAEKIQSYADFIKDQKPAAGKTTVYVCRNYQCELPVTELRSLESLLHHEK